MPVKSSKPSLRIRIAAASTGAVLLCSGIAAAPAFAAPATDTVSIAEIQGTGAETPLKGQTVTTEPSIVTAVYPGDPGTLGGFVIQTPGSGGKVDMSKASTGVFVYTGSTQSTVSVGDRVQVTGEAGEYRGLTQLEGNIEITPVAEELPAVEPATNDWASTAATRENLESMLYKLKDKFQVADTYGLGRYGELGLAAGKELPAQPTQVARPGSAEAQAQAERNSAISVTLDDGTNRGFAASPTQEPRQVPYLTREDPVAVGDSARITKPVIVDYRFDKWRFQPTSPVVPGEEPARFSGSADPKSAVGGQMRIASFNVLNYFTTVGQEKGCRGGNYSTDGTYNVAQNCDVRGAFDQADFQRQQAKTVSAINQLDASVVGLMEVENSVKLGEPKDEALQNLVAALNKAAGFKKWDLVSVPDSELQPVADQDFITNAIIYQPKQVTQVGRAQALGSEAVAGGAFENARTPLAATFTSTKGGGKHGAAPTTVVVNHFKSKGSAPRTGPNRASGDGQGAWNAARVAQASAVVNWIPELSKAAGSEDVAVLGDFNSYAQEDPMQEFYGAGYTQATEDDYTYVFGGQVGSLDHMLVSPSLKKRMTGADAWNINSGQSPLLQYSQYRTTALDYYVANEIASSDHDPYIAGFRASKK